MTQPDPRRLVVVEETRGWLGSPYHHIGRVKGAGTDCLMMLAEVYEAPGAVPHIEVPFYPADWNLHRGAERYSTATCRTRSKSRVRDSQAMSWFFASAAATPTGR